MNDDDLLAKATRELRDAGDPPLPELRQTRRRIVEAAGRAEKPSRRWVWLVWQLAAFMLAATALAATTGQLQPMIQRVREVLGGAAEPAPESSSEGSGARGAGRPRPTVSTAPSNAVPAELTARAALEPAPLAEDPLVRDALAHGAPAEHSAGATPGGQAESAAEPRASAGPGGQPAHAAAAQDEHEAPLAGSGVREDEAPAPTSADDAEVGLAHANDPDLALYREAHRAHFVQRNWSAALAAWDRYLAAHPRGNFAVEARYNRALCLVRLGRHEAARQALTPFAAGSVGGGYRRTEASALLEALEGR